jgi:uncharacterized protein YbaA (DUF1428 family)
MSELRVESFPMSIDGFSAGLQARTRVSKTRSVLEDWRCMSGLFLQPRFTRCLELKEVHLAKLAEYRRRARKAGKIRIEHGALEVHECVADDVQTGKHTSFPQVVKLEAEETVVFSWTVFKSRKDRDRVNAKVVADPRLAFVEHADPASLPFDGQRMFWGGFKAVVSLTG